MHRLKSSFLLAMTCALALGGCAATRVRFEETPQAPPPPAASPAINIGASSPSALPSARAFEYFSQKDVDIRGFEFIEERKPDGSYKRVVKLQRGTGDPTEVNATTAHTIERMFLAGLQAGSALAGRTSTPATPPATPVPQDDLPDDAPR